MTSAARILLEVCIESVDDALAAAAGGADRLELCAALNLGGITPSLGLLMEVRRRIGPEMPIVALVRPRAGDFCHSDTEFDVVRRDVDLLFEHGASGVALGILTPDSRIDHRRCRALIEQARTQPAATEGAVFHRAFDFVIDPLAALDELIELGFRRVLTSGQRTTALEGADEIAAYIRHVGDRIEILPGAGICPENVREVVLRSGCRQVHGSFREKIGSGNSLAGPEPSLSLGDSTADRPHSGTSCRLVQEVVEKLRLL